MKRSEDTSPEIFATTIKKDNPSIFDKILKAHAEGNIDLVRALVEEHAISMPTHAYMADESHWGQGITMLHLAAFYGLSHTAKDLIENGADVNRVYKALTPMWCAASNNHIDTVRTLIEEDADITATGPEHSTTLLSWADAYSKTELADFLIEKGADVSKRNNF